MAKTLSHRSTGICLKSETNVQIGNSERTLAHAQTDIMQPAGGTSREEWENSEATRQKNPPCYLSRHRKLSFFGQIQNYGGSFSGPVTAESPPLGSKAQMGRLLPCRLIDDIPSCRKAPQSDKAIRPGTRQKRRQLRMKRHGPHLIGVSNSRWRFDRLATSQTSISL